MNDLTDISGSQGDNQSRQLAVEAFLNTKLNVFLNGKTVCLTFIGITRKTRIMDVVYNASNNELVRTKTLVKNCIVQVDSNPFRQW